MEDCVLKGIDLSLSHAHCSYLFRCLISPSGDPIGGLIYAMTMINSSSKIDDIARLFREVSKLLKDIGPSKAALLLKPLQSKAIFPITNGSKSQSYDVLLGAYDEDWFIADQADIFASFTAVVPLLALSIQDLPAVQDLLRALRVNGRYISKMTTSQIRVVGDTRSDIRYTEEFRSKSPFIKA